MAQLLQQHINRGNKRIARMTGRTEPDEHELTVEMHKRMYLLDSSPESRVRSACTEAESDFSKRYFRHSAHEASKNTSCTNTTSGTNTPSSTNTSSTNTTATGVSPIDIQAATNGGLTLANKPTANNTLGLNIE
jgi:hypothetical protein